MHLQVLSKMDSVMRKYDLYEFLGFISPGIVYCVSLGYVWPTKLNDLFSKDITLGGVTIGIVFAYAAGQLLQAIGNFLECILWKCLGGKPTDWLRTAPTKIVDAKQLPMIERQVQKMLSDDTFEMNIGLDTKGWYSITRQIYTCVSASNHAKRIDIFNANYGLCRGLAAAMMVLLLINILFNFKEWQMHIVLAILVGLAVYRFYRFGVIYARELFVQFLQSNSGNP